MATNTVKSNIKKNEEPLFSENKIKKIIQENKNIGKLANGVTFTMCKFNFKIAKSVEYFIRDLILESCELAKNSEGKLLTQLHLKEVINNNKKYEFLKGLVSDISIPEKKKKTKKEEEDNKNSNTNIKSKETKNQKKSSKKEDNANVKYVSLNKNNKTNCELSLKEGEESDYKSYNKGDMDDVSF